MTPLAALPPGSLGALRGVLFDLDDTVLSHGALTREAFDAVWRLSEAGLGLVAVTGRPSSWGEVVVRQWPIDGAVTENGAVFVVREGRGVAVTLDGSAAEVAERRAKLDALIATAARLVPRANLADDVHGRRADVAWDLAERTTLAPKDVVALGRLIVEAGARMTRSSVHMHATFERDDKASGAIRFLRTRFEEDAGGALSRWAFVGDSGNDAACFSAFRQTFGVANVRDHLRHLVVPPRWVAARERGAGFAEIASAILASR